MPDVGEQGMNAVKLAQAARRAAMTIASDPDVRHYSSDTIALVLKRTLVNFVAAGSWDQAAVKQSTDPALDGVPIEAITAITQASIIHFARALSDTVQSGEPDADQHGPIGPRDSTRSETTAPDSARSDPSTSHNDITHEGDQ